MAPRPSDCEVHKYHRPTPAETEEHHVHPLEWGGADTPRNVVQVCPTGHVNIHSLLDAYVEHDGDPPWEVLRDYGAEERTIAEKGYRMAAKAGHGLVKAS